MQSFSNGPDLSFTSLPDTIVTPPVWILVPQGAYRALQPIEGWIGNQSIEFSSTNGQGVPLIDVLRRDYSQMNGRDELTGFEGPSISLRFEVNIFCQLRLLFSENASSGPDIHLGLAR